MRKLISSITRKIKEYKKLYEEFDRALDYGENKVENYKSFSKYKASLKEFA